MYRNSFHSQHNLNEENQSKLAHKKIQELTPREYEILHYIVAGCPNKIIAYILNISQRSVENHRAHIMQKTNTNSLAALVSLFALGENMCLLDCLGSCKCTKNDKMCYINKNILKSDKLNNNKKK